MLPSRQTRQLRLPGEEMTGRTSGSCPTEVGWTRPDLLKVRKGSNRQRYKSCKRFKRTDSVKRSDASSFVQLCWPELRSAGVSGAHSTLTMLVKQDKETLLKQRKVVRALLTILDLTLPDSQDTWYYKVKWWKIATDSVIRHRRTQPFIREWKQHILWVQNSIFGRDPEDPYPKYKPSWPALPEGTWLTETTLTRDGAANCVEYCTSRGFPSADGEEQEDQVQKTIIRYCSFVPKPISEEDKELVQRCSAICGAEVRKCAIDKKILSKMHSHVSLTNSGCYERSTLEGGKSTYLGELFYQWLQEEVLSEELYFLPVGGSAIFRSGHQRWQMESDYLGEAPIGVFGSEIENSGWINPSLTGLEENRLSVLLWVFCYTQLLKNEYIKPNGRPTGKMFKTQVLKQGEPGGKTRVPTKSEAFLTTYLQPYAHVMRAVLETDPTLESGLSAGNQAWRMIQSLERSFGSDFTVKSVFDGILLGDLETSTDYMEFEVVRLHWESFWSTWTGVSDYFRYAHELFSQPFLMFYDGTWEIARRGALMGLPGVKPTLHTFSKAIDVGARELVSPRDPFTLSRHPWRCAGDDIASFGSLSELRKYKRIASCYRVKPSDDKWGVYLKGGRFCERAIFLEGFLNTKDLQISAYVDIIPPRLLSPESKTGRGDNDTNPIFGKGYQLSRELEWYSGPRDKAILAVSLFLENFRDYGNYEMLAYLPRPLMGFGLANDPEHSYKITDQVVMKTIRRAKLREGFQAREAYAALNALRTPLLYDRGRPLAHSYSENPYDMILEYLPWVTTETAFELLEIPQHLNFRKKIERLEQESYVELETLLRRAKNPTPFFERALRKGDKGWRTAPLNVRIESIANRLDLSGDNPVSMEEWSELYSTPTLRPEPKWIPSDYLTIFGDGEVVPLNISGRDCALSISMKLPNRTLFESSAFS